eukprot:4664551-Ditylum_brightwellii.AAC.1
MGPQRCNVILNWHFMLIEGVKRKTIRKWGKKGHCANKCSKDKMERAISAFGIEGSNDKGYESDNNNEFIHLTAQHIG